jgi:hypothetical protein
MLSLLLSLWLTLGLNTDGSIISAYGKSDSFVYELCYSTKSNTILRSWNLFSLKGEEASVAYQTLGKGILDYSAITTRICKYFNIEWLIPAEYGFGLNNYIKFTNVIGYGTGCCVFVNFYGLNKQTGIRFLIDSNIGIYRYSSVLLMPSISLFANIEIF